MFEQIASAVSEVEPSLLLAWEVTAVGFSLCTAGHALLHKRNPRPATMWIVICVALPVVGAIAYWTFGFNRVSMRAEALRRRWPDPVRGTVAVESSPNRLDAQGGDCENAEVGLRVTGRPLLPGNQVATLRNGEAAYPPMLDAIRGATSTVWLSTYIFDRDEVGVEFADALGSAVDRGVDVRVLIDGLGEWYSPRRIGTLLKRRGVTVERFLMPKLFPPSLHINLRYHRKLLIVDGVIAFTGGMNIGKRHRVAGRAKQQGTRDIHFDVRGPVVRDMEEVFREDWTFADPQATWPELRPRAEQDARAGGSHARAVISGPNEDLENIRWILLGALSNAKRSIRIMTPYFIGEPTLVAALNAAALRGVAVELILPAHNNLAYMGWAARSQLWQVLEFGVRVYEQAGVFSHTKLVLIDGDYALVGSSNLDPRSLRLNFEFNLEVCGGQCPAELAEHFETSLKESRELTLAELDGRPLWMRLRDAFAALFSPYL